MPNYRERKALVYKELKKACAECGVYHPHGMHVDHINASVNPFRGNGAKGRNYKYGPDGEKVSWSHGCDDAYNRLMAGEDITKSFQLLCGFHHQIKTYEDLHGRPEQVDMFIAGPYDDLDFLGNKA